MLFIFLAIFRVKIFLSMKYGDRNQKKKKKKQKQKQKQKQKPLFSPQVE